MIRWLLPQGADPAVAPVFLARALRGFADGFVSVLLPVYLIALGLGGAEVGAIATTTLFGSAIATLAVGAWGARWHDKVLLLSASLLMVATGIGFSALSSFWPLLIVAFVGTLNPSSGDVSVFLPLEHARLAAHCETASRTELFARYALTGALCGAAGALAAGLPEQIDALSGIGRLESLRLMFLLYGLIGVMVWVLYGRMPVTGIAAVGSAAPLTKSRSIVIRLSALFSLDSFAGGLVLNSLLALWLFDKFQLSLTATGSFFFVSGLLGAISQLAAPRLAKQFGMVNTMVFTHIPASLFLIAAAFASDLRWVLALLFARALVSSMDVPARSAFVMSVVEPHERAAAASFTAVPRSLAAAASPLLAGWLFQSGWMSLPLIICGVLKITYDLMLWGAFKSVEQRGSTD
jgi:MFS family permease